MPGSQKKRVDFNISRVHQEAFVERAARSAKENGMVFDTCSREGYYKKLSKNETYKTKDLCKHDKNLPSLVFYFLELCFFYIGKGHGKNFCGVAVKPAR